MFPLERQFTSPSDGTAIQPVTRQATSPFDNGSTELGQPVSRQATSPFDQHSDTSVGLGSDRVKKVGEGKAEYTAPGLRLVYNSSEVTSLYVAESSVEGVRIGERIEVADWSKNNGLLMNFNSKKCFAGGSLTQHPVDSKARANAEKFAKVIAEVTGMTFTVLLQTLAKTADQSSISLWRAQILAAALTAPETVRF